MTSIRKGRADALAAFLAAHPTGWDHHDWERLFAELCDRGLALEEERAEIGRELEQARVLNVLADMHVTGLGPKRRHAVASAYGRLWELRNASAEEIAGLPGLTRRIAEDLVAALR